MQSGHRRDRQGSYCARNRRSRWCDGSRGGLFWNSVSAAESEQGSGDQGPRTQADRVLYREGVARTVARSAMTVIEGEVSDILVENRRAAGVVTRDGSSISSKSVILTTGTFLNGVIHMGSETRPPVGSATRRRSLGGTDIGYRSAAGRLETGTPPRLAGSSIDWGVIESQPADVEPEFLSFLTRHTRRRQVSCGMTHTNQQTHDIIKRTSVKQSPMAGLPQVRVRGTARPSRTKSSVLRTRRPIRCFSSLRGSRRIWSIPMEFRRRFRRMYRSSMFGAFRD